MKRSAFPLVLMALLAALPALAAQWNVTPEATVNADRYTLADLVPGGPEAFSRRSLGAAPRPGQSLEVSGSWLASRIPDAANFIIPPVVRVTRPGRELTRADVEEALLDAARQRWGDDVALTVGEVGLPGTLPLGELRLDVRLPEGRPGKNATVWADVRVDGVQRARAWAKLVDGGARASAKASASRTAPGVAKGDLVRLVARSGSITVSTQAKALASASVGQTVAVENLVSKKTLLGVVAEAGVVETATAAREVN